MTVQSSWKILNLELSEDIPELPARSDCQGLFVVFWWHQIPLGHQEISAKQLPLSAIQLANLALQAITPAVSHHLVEHKLQASPLNSTERAFEDAIADFDPFRLAEKPLARLQQRSPQPTGSTVSVVICTRDRPEELTKCLRSLQALSHFPHEILIVDNAPTSNATRQLVEQVPGVRYVLESRPGLSIARNTGIHHTTGDIVAFTDDDVIVHPDWIMQLQQGFQDPKVMAVTGLMLPAELETEAQLIFQQGSGGPKWNYQSHIFDSQFFNQRKHEGVPVWKIGAGANMAFRREIFDRVGLFDPRLGAGASGCSEDSELWYRVLAEGWLCRYEPAAVVFHYHRRDIDSLEQQMYQYMRGHIVALLIQFSRYGHWGNLRRLFIVLPNSYTKLFIRGLLKGFRQSYRTIPAEILGCLSGLKFYLQNWV